MLIRFNFGNAGTRSLKGFVDSSMKPFIVPSTVIDEISHYEIFDCPKNRETIEKFYPGFEIIEEKVTENSEEKVNLTEEGFTPNPEVKKRRKKEG